MWFTIIFLSVGVICLVLAKILWKDESWIGAPLVTLGIASLIFFSWIVPLFIGEVIDDDLYVEVETIEARLLSIKDNSLVEGRFYLMAGYISTETYYFYYTQASDGAIELKKIPTESVRLYEDSAPGTAYILKKEKVIPRELVDSAKWHYFPNVDFTLSREIHVPPGTVVRDFVLDAE